MEKAQVTGAVQVWGEPGDAAPLGWLSFGLTLFILSVNLIGWGPPLAWVTIAIFFGGATQFIVGMIEFGRNRVFNATYFSTYGSFWLGLMSYYCFYLLPGATFYNAKLKAEDSLAGIAWFVTGFFIFNTVYLVCAVMESMVVFATVFLMEIAMICLMIGGFNNVAPETGATAAGGYFGFFCSIAAFYACFALTFNALAEREVIPLGAPILNMRRSPPPPPETGASYDSADAPIMHS